MSIPRSKPTIRGLLLIVAVVAVALGGFLAVVRWERGRQPRYPSGTYVDPSTRSSGELISADEY
jgi:hypothetical protein